MLDKCDSFNGAIIVSCRCVKLLIPGYISPQVEDSNADGEIKVKFIRNTREIHDNSKNSKKKHFKIALLTDWLFYPNLPKL